MRKRFDGHVWRLHRKIDRQVDTVQSCGAGLPLSESEVSLIERATMQLQIEWEHFVRSFVLDCATGRFEDRNGPIVSHLPLRLASREKASHVLIQTYKKRRREPDWYLPDQAIDAADRLRLSNFQNISIILGVTPWLIEDLRHLRNFIAHQSKDTALKVRKSNLLTVSNRIAPAQSALSYGVGGVRRVVTSSNFMKAISRYLL